MDKLNVTRAVKERGLKMQDVAAVLGITKIAMSARVNGNPKLKSLEEIARVVGCNVRDFFYPEDGGNWPDATGDAQNQEEQPKEEDKKEDTKQSNAEGGLFAEQLVNIPPLHRAIFCPRCGTRFIVTDIPEPVTPRQ